MSSFKPIKEIRSAIDRIDIAIQNVSKVDCDYIIKTINPEKRALFDDLIKLLTPLDDGIVEVEDEEEIDEEIEEEEINEEPFPQIEESPKIEIKTDPTLLMFSQDWLKYKRCTWKRDMGQTTKRFRVGVMISEFGDVWDMLNNKLLEPHFTTDSDCEMKVMIGKECFVDTFDQDQDIRIAPMVCRCWGINSNTREKIGAARYVIDYIDGDRRNLRPENLKWVRKSRYTKERSRMVAEDICRRLVDNKGDVDKTFAMYNDRGITKPYVDNIRNKLIEVKLSNEFFTLDENKNLIPVIKEDNSKKIIMPYELTHEPDDILEANIRKGTLTLGEKNLILVKALDILREESPHREITAEEVVDLVRDMYKIPISTDMAAIVIGGEPDE